MSYNPSSDLGILRIYHEHISTMICSPRYASSRCVVASVGRNGGGFGPSPRRDGDDTDDVAIVQEGHCTTP